MTLAYSAFPGQLPCLPNHSFSKFPAYSRHLAKRRLSSRGPIGALAISHPWLGSTTLFATISRGGYLSLAVALVIMGAAHMSTWRRWVRLVAYHLLVFAVTISLLGVAAQICPRDTISGMSAVRAIVDQLSLGTIHQPLPAPTPRTRDDLASPSDTTGRLPNQLDNLTHLYG